jgi:hypothetical protein
MGRRVEVTCLGRCVVGAWCGLRELMGMTEIRLKSGLWITWSCERKQEKDRHWRDDGEEG